MILKNDPFYVMFVPIMILFAISLGYFACVSLVYDSVDMPVKETLWGVFIGMVGMVCIGVVIACVLTLIYDLTENHRRKNNIIIFDDLSYQSRLMTFDDYWKCKNSRWRQVN